MREEAERMVTIAAGGMSVAAVLNDPRVSYLVSIAIAIAYAYASRLLQRLKSPATLPPPPAAAPACEVCARREKDAA